LERLECWEKIYEKTEIDYIKGAVAPFLFGEGFMKEKVIRIIKIGIILCGIIILGKMSMFQAPKLSTIISSNEKIKKSFWKPEIAEWNQDITNILLIGQDRRPNETDRARADSIILMNLNKDTGNIKLISFMRDLYVSIPGYKDNRLNAAYKYGGAALLNQTLEENFGIQIDANIEVDFSGFKEIIDAVGGIDMFISQDEIPIMNGYIKDINLQTLQADNINQILEEGIQHLNGTQALAYARIRYVGNGDFERTNRQRKILLQIAKKATDMDLLQLISLYKKICPYFATTLSESQILSLVSMAFKMDIKNISTYNIPENASYTSARKRGMDVLVPDLEICQEVLQTIITE